MARNLFIDDVERITLAEVEEFVGLRLPVDQQMREGFRVDFKGVDARGALQNASIAKTVAAFSNTFGGLILVGLTGKPPQAPLEIVGARRAGELKTKLANIIRSSVLPPPRFRIGVVECAPIEGQPADVAIVQVEEGNRPPYAYADGPTQTVVVRSNDVSSPAKLVELDALYSRRAALEGNSEMAPPPPEPQLGKPAARLILQPARQLGVVLHRAIEDQFSEAISTTFRRETGGQRERGGFHVQIGTQEAQLVKRQWSLDSTGTVVFATEVVRTNRRTGDSGILLVDVLADMVLACRAAAKLFSALDWHGQLRLTLEFVFGDGRIFNQSSRDLDLLRLNLDSLNPAAIRAERGDVAVPADASELGNAESLVALLSMLLLRILRGGDMDLDLFTRSLRDACNRPDL